MDFDDTPGAAAFRAEAFEWLSRHAEPRSPASGPAPLGDADPEAELRHVKRSKEWRRTLYEGGWAGITWPTVRHELVLAYTRLQVMKYLGWRVPTAVSKGQQPGPESSVLKLALSQHQGVTGDLIMDILGPEGTLIDYGDSTASAWQLQFMGHWGSRIGGGTEQVQRNIIGERVLGLPGEPRVDKEASFGSSLR